MSHPRRGDRSRRTGTRSVPRLALIVGGVLVITLIIVITILSWRHGESHRLPAAARFASASPTGLPTTDMRRLERALNSPSRTAQAAALVPEEREAFLATGESLPSGDKFVINQSSFNQTGSLSAMVTATTSHGTKWTLLLYWENGKWYITTTMEGV